MVNIVSRCDLRIETFHRNQPNNSKPALINVINHHGLTAAVKGHCRNQPSRCKLRLYNKLLLC